MKKVSPQIELRGVRVHNLKNIDLDLPHNQLITLCGVSGSGKTSLALDTLYAEGQRRYLESFSARTRQSITVQEKADADSISGIPAAIAVTRNNARSKTVSTIGTATEIQGFISLLFSRIAGLHCFDCQQIVRRDNPDSVSGLIAQFPSDKRLLIGFPVLLEQERTTSEEIVRLRQEGFMRALVDGELVNLADPDVRKIKEHSRLDIVVDRLKTDRLTMANPTRTASDSVAGDAVVGGSRHEESTNQRLLDSLATAFTTGDGRCFVMVETGSAPLPNTPLSSTINIAGKPFVRIDFNRKLICQRCDIKYPDPQPRLFSWTSVLGACPNCEGFGKVPEFDMDLIVPNPAKTIRAGAIAPWTTSAYKHELAELIALADDYDLPVDAPFSQLTEAHRQLIWEGVPERKFGGLTGFFRWLEDRRDKAHIRVFFNRWRSKNTCEVCEGDRFNELALAFRLGDIEIDAEIETNEKEATADNESKSDSMNRSDSMNQFDSMNVAEMSAISIVELREWLPGLKLTDYQRKLSSHIVDQILTRLNYLCDVGLGYLSLNRSLNELSGGEAQRVALTAAIGSRLVNMLYVLDEPTSGLHASELPGLIQAIRNLAQRGNTVVCVEHNPQVFEASDQLIEVGPKAGKEGGEILFQGSLRDLEKTSDSITGMFLNSRNDLHSQGSDATSSNSPDVISPSHISSGNRREIKQGSIRLMGATGRNLKNVTVEFPIGVLNVVTGVSGAGKTTLVTDTLHPAICQRLEIDNPVQLDCQGVAGLGPIEDVTLVDQSPIGRSPKSNPATFTKSFDAIRAVFAETVDAKTQNYRIGHFSFNSELGRCPTCKGDGYLTTDMKFLADVLARCGDCQGTRYRREILSVRYRGMNISDVLNMSVREAFAFFRGQTKVQNGLRQMLEVGLDYLQLGQPASTLSTGEAQRLKLASHLATVSRKSTLFILDEPTSGLHFADIVKLLECFQSLLNVGHSLIVVTHNLQLMCAADHVIDLGPGAAELGGEVVATGTPEEVAACSTSITGSHLRIALERGLCHA